MDPSPGTLHPGSRKQLWTQLNIIIMLAGSCKAVPFSQFDEEMKVIVSHFKHIAATKLGFPRWLSHVQVWIMFSYGLLLAICQLEPHVHSFVEW